MEYGACSDLNQMTFLHSPSAVCVCEIGDVNYVTIYLPRILVFMLTVLDAGVWLYTSVFGDRG